MINFALYEKVVEYLTHDADSTLRRYNMQLILHFHYIFVENNCYLNLTNEQGRSHDVCSDQSWTKQLRVSNKTSV